MTTFHCWFEGYRNNENPIEVEADAHDEAAEKFASDDFWLNDSDNRKAYMAPGEKGKTVWVQARGDDTARAFAVSGEASVEFWVDEVCIPPLPEGQRFLVAKEASCS